MEFRANQASARLNSEAQNYFTENLSDTAAGIKLFNEVQNRLGNAVESLPEWHPILTEPTQRPWNRQYAYNYSKLPVYKGCDHTRMFVRGLLTCPYSKAEADKIVAAVNREPNLCAELLDGQLYADSAFPVLIEATEVELEADGTIRSRDALAWFVQTTVANARNAEVAETWWNIRDLILGRPHGARSSLLVNDYTGRNMRKILETLNESGMFGPVKEDSLDMLSQRKRDAIGQTLLKAALNAASPLDSVNSEAKEFTFELRGETCRARIRDTWNDGFEYSLQVTIGQHDLTVSGFYYPAKNKLENFDPNGKRKLAEKFV